MENKPTFNFNAQTYVPKSLRQQDTQPPKKVYYL